MTQLEEYEYLWDGSDDWVLLANEPSSGVSAQSLTIYNRATMAALVVEDDALHTKICEQMLKCGVPVVTPGPRDFTM